jgi:hypothetical protein
MEVITVGESSSWVQELVDRASKLKVGSGFDPSTDVYVPSWIMSAWADDLEDQSSRLQQKSGSKV